MDEELKAVSDPNSTNQSEVDVIKLCALGFSYHDRLSAQELIFRSVLYWYRFWKQTGGDVYRQEVANHIRAYLELGYLLQERVKELQEIVFDMGLDFDMMEQGKKAHAIAIRLTENAISAVIGKWPNAKCRTCTRPFLIQDIYQKVKEKQCGVYHYESRFDDKGRYAAKWKLVISEERSWLYDILNQKVYYFRSED